MSDLFKSCSGFIDLGVTYYCLSEEDLICGAKFSFGRPTPEMAEMHLANPQRVCIHAISHPPSGLRR